MLLSITDLTKRFGAVSILDGVSLEVAAGETVALTGESGSGKSTLLHIAGALEQFDGGSVSIEGKSLAQLTEAGRASLRRERIGLVFQQFNLIPSLKVEANVAFQARLAGRFEKDATDTLIERLGLGAHRDKFPEELSGGQQQRVAIGRAVAARPALLLADEPTGNLDEKTGDDVFSLLLSLAKDADAGLLIVTHSERLAARADRRLTLTHGRVSE